MSRREAEEERQRAATLIQQAWSCGYKRACEVGGAIFVPMALTPYGGWHKEKGSAESWTRRTTHTGDGAGYYEFDQRFEHPGRTWASATHRAFTFACVGAAMANETWKFVQAKSKQAMKQVLGIKNDAARMKVTPPLAVAPLHVSICMLVRMFVSPHVCMFVCPPARRITPPTKARAGAPPRRHRSIRHWPPKALGS